MGIFIESHLSFILILLFLYPEITAEIEFNNQYLNNQHFRKQMSTERRKSILKMFFVYKNPPAKIYITIIKCLKYGIGS